MFLVVSWVSYVVITVSVQFNGAVLTDIILLTLCDYIEDVPTANFPAQTFWQFYLRGRMLRGWSRCVHIFL